MNVPFANLVDDSAYWRSVGVKAETRYEHATVETQYERVHQVLATMSGF